MAINTNVTAPVNVTSASVTNTVLEPPKEGQSSNAQVVQAVEAWKHSYFLYPNYVLNGLVDDLYNVYYKITTTKELQESLERKGQQAGTENTYAPDSTKANMVEHVESSSKSNSKEMEKAKRRMTRRENGNISHRAANCKMPKWLNLRQDNMVNDNMDMIAMVSDVIAMISEVKLVGSNNSGWWVDTGETRYVCAEKSMFHSFRAVDNGEKLYMGNSATADLQGQGDVILKMTSEKELKLTNVLYGCSQESCVWGYAMNGMFKLNVIVVKNVFNKVNSSAYLIESSNVWHGRLRHVYLLKSKDEAIDKFILYKTKVKNQLGRKIKVVRSDRGENKPTSYREAITSSEGQQWKEAIKSEIDFILQNHTWELVDLPPGCKTLGYKWILKKKMKANGTIDKYKARLIIKGFKQEGLDYFDTYSPIT
uniref:Enoyl-[acyl-carrier-protein] reductase [NADH], chloroplastic n=1 Tax=Tanacetum cinerariifolium TaxID=118510 RepID=A0A699GP54_TANCI|nr:enoyl-[acyl-carrier-protein] reductase [NADH], chloroplastic [Tanacetum cinerariifolium]